MRCELPVHLSHWVSINRHGDRFLATRVTAMRIPGGAYLLHRDLQPGGGYHLVSAAVVLTPKLEQALVALTRMRQAGISIR